MTRRAFTLIEILIAVVIIALGMIGLAALFAGTARQQQVASTLTKSITASKNAESIAVEKFSTLRDVSDLQHCVPAYAGDPALVPADQRLTPEWRRLNVSEFGNILGLYQQPFPSNANACGTMFFERPLPDITFIDLSQEYAAYLSNPGANGPLMNPHINKFGFDDATSAPTQLPALAGFRRFFSKRSVIPEDIEFEVWVASTEPLDIDYPPGTHQVFLYRYDIANNSGPPVDPAGPDEGGPCNKRYAYFSPVSPHPNATAQCWDTQKFSQYDYIRLDTRKCPIDPEPTGGGGPSPTDPASIDKIRIFPVLEPAGSALSPCTPIEPTPRNGRFILKLIARNVKYRSLEVLSLRERVQAELTSEGLKDTIGASVLVRAPQPETLQVATFTYSLFSEKAGARYIPWETNQWPYPGFRAAEEIHRPIRRAEVRLVYAVDQDAYFVFCRRGSPAEDQGWIARAGQTLLFAGDTKAAVPVLGADDIVKIISVTTLNNASGYWCRLDKAPRSAGAVVGGPVLRVNSLPNGPSGRALDVYAVNLQVRALDDSDDAALRQVDGKSNGTFWRLTPIDARVTTLSR